MKKRVCTCCSRLDLIGLLVFGLCRFPDDLYDRYWKSPGSSYTIATMSTTTNLVIPTIIFDNPPVKVMQTAWSDPSFWFNSPFPQETTTIFYVTLYFVEVGTLKATDRRSIDIYLNDAIWFRGYNVSKTVDEVFFSEDPILVNKANFSLYRDSASTLDPLLNAAELHAIYDTVTTTTVSTDGNSLVIIMIAVLHHFADWSVCLDSGLNFFDALVLIMVHDAFHYFDLSKLTMLVNGSTCF